MQILDNKAAGNRLNAILGSRVGLSDIIRDSKIEPQKTASTIRVHDFLGQKSISEADVMVLIHWGVKEILLSQRTIISPLAGDLLKQEGIKLRYNDNLAKQGAILNHPVRWQEFSRVTQCQLLNGKALAEHRCNKSLNVHYQG